MHLIDQRMLGIAILFLLVVNPIAAILLITRRLATIDPTHMAIEDGLRKAYGKQYVAYQQKTRILIPFVY